MKNLAVLVLSCDKYSSLWDIFFDRWAYYWADCPLPIYLVSNEKNYVRNNVRSIMVGEDKDWSSNLLSALKEIDKDNLLLMIEDAPLDDYVNRKRFEEIYSDFLELNANYMNLKSSPAPQRKTNEFRGELAPDTLYRTALVPCIWKKNILENLLVAGESAWQFEILGSKRSSKYDKFYSTFSPFFRLLHYVIKGKIDRRSARILAKTGELKNIEFPIMTRYEYLKYLLVILRSIIFNLIVPDRFKAAIRSIFKFI